MSKPSLSDFLQSPAPVVKTKPEPVTKGGEEIKGITIRLKQTEWQHMVELTMTERTKIQPYILGLIQADFEKRGLRF